MKKSNVLLSVLFLLAVVCILGVTACQKQAEDAALPNTPTAQSAQETETKIDDPEDNTAIQQVKQAKEALFIGDSRAVGLSEYGKMSGVDFFANVGMTVYNVREKKLSVPTVGKVTLDDLLNHKKYDRVYIMLGINEAGYAVNQTVAQYQNLIEEIQKKQPQAQIFLQANLHVTQERSQKDKVINNAAIDTLNQKIAALADRKTVYYLDANPLFDDANGNLAAEKSGDTAHLYAKYYAQWGTWILRQTETVA